jgi:hypothetical protein
LNIRNGVNVFGLLFRWVGFLAAADVAFTSIFLLFWFLVMRPDVKRAQIHDDKDDDCVMVMKGEESPSNASLVKSATI